MLLHSPVNKFIKILSFPRMGWFDFMFLHEPCGFFSHRRHYVSVQLIFKYSYILSIYLLMYVYVMFVFSLQTYNVYLEELAFISNQHHDTLSSENTSSKLVFYFQYTFVIWQYQDRFTVLRSDKMRIFISCISAPHSFCMWHCHQ